MKKIAIIVSGYFNPIHRGHLEYLNLSKKKGDILIVIVNNDHQRLLKGSSEFMLEKERTLILGELRCVDKVFLSIDKDRTVVSTIEKIHSLHYKDFELFFANGGDQNNKICPEADICNKLNIQLIDGLGDKIQSSSWLLKK